MKDRLEREAFADALHKGPGRAFLHVKHHGIEDVADLVLEAEKSTISTPISICSLL